MYDNYQLQDYLKKLYNHVEKQNIRIGKLEMKIEKINSELKSIKEKPLNIEKIEYKFDQLKVERLEGTLNIGITPNGENIEEFAVNNSEVFHTDLENKYLELTEQIKHEVDQYLTKEAFMEINTISNKFKFPLDKSYQQLIIDDINKQIDQRIQLYINKYGNDIETNKPNVKETIIKKVKSDIKEAIEVFIKHLPREGSQS